MDWFGSSECCNHCNETCIGGMRGSTLFFFFACIWSSEMQFLGPSPWDWGKWQHYLVRAEGSDTNHCYLFSFSSLLSGQFVSCALFLMTKVLFNLIINLIKLISIFKTSWSLLPACSHECHSQKVPGCDLQVLRIWDLGLTSVDQFTPASSACPGGEGRSDLWSLVLVSEM